MAALPLSHTSKNEDGWGSVHLDPNEPGVMDYVDQLETFAIEQMATVNISFDESYPPNFDHLRREYQMHVDSKYASTFFLVFTQFFFFFFFNPIFHLKSTKLRIVYDLAL